MTPRQRWEAVLRGERPDRVPCDYWGTSEITSRLKRELGCAGDRELWERLGIDKLIHLVPRHPRATEEVWHLQSFFSVWHIGTRKVPYADGLGFYEEAIEPPLAAATSVARYGAVRLAGPRRMGRWPLARAMPRAWRDYPLLAAVASCSTSIAGCAGWSRRSKT